MAVFNDHFSILRGQSKIIDDQISSYWYDLAFGKSLEVWNHFFDDAEAFTGENFFSDSIPRFAVSLGSDHHINVAYIRASSKDLLKDDFS